MADLSILIVDDEPLGRERIRTLLAGRGDVQRIDEAVDGAEAIDMLGANDFDLVFLDIQMPHADGFDVIRTVGVDAMPPIVFVTAYDEHALQAFNVHALDYLLKPFEPERFHQALERVLEVVRGRKRGDLDDRVRRLIEGLEPEKAPPLKRLIVKTHQKAEFVRTEDIDWIEAAGNYVKIHEGKREHLLRQTMAQMERRLDGDRFLRIHRSTIVNLDRVRNLHTLANGEVDVRLDDGTKLTLSRGYRHTLERFT